MRARTRGTVGFRRVNPAASLKHATRIIVYSRNSFADIRRLRGAIGSFRRVNPAASLKP